MKKLALLLAAVGMVSAVAYGAPELKVTSVGQEIEIENSNHNGTDLDDVWLFNNVGLAYGDWTFGLQAGKQWDVNFEDHDTSDKGVSSADHRLQIDVWNKVTDDLKLGFRYRGTKSYDRYYGRWDWSNGMLWSAGDVWYEAHNGIGSDWLKAEVFPIGIKYGALKVGYYYQYYTAIGGDVTPGTVSEETEHQIRAYAPLYQGEKLSLSTEARLTLAHDVDHDKAPAKGYREYDNFGRLRVYLKANYAMTENLSVYGSYAWEFRDFEMTGDYKNDHTENAYQDFVIGWSYKF
ncbi:MULTISPECIES: hypothetical protein [Fusobacterium]|uniref:hypothetical protein n=1 Tax=Fusobacterium TaxID=848 RepID=UPI001477533B|nr:MULTISPECIES: hypothetical protein [Fusobacterium]NME36307.1 hypothetical protein [Fusobacterium sp. FSA-380-WT-3A]